MLSRIWSWANERWPLSAVVRWSLEEEIEGGSSYIYTLGSALLAVFLLQVSTGIIQLFFYVPYVESAYNSVSFLRTQVPFGWLVNQVHRHGADVMVALAALHLTRVYIFGAYKQPRELTWLIGVGLLVTVMALTFTGGPLPWDQKGYWEAEVGSNIPGSIPVIGGEIIRLMRGGGSMGQLALSRLFGVHVGILPLLLAVLIILHLVAFRRFGTVGPWDESKRNFSEPFWPDQVFKDTVVAILVVLIIVTLSVFAPKPFYGPADPLDASFTPKPEWNFLFLYQSLKYFHGALEPVGVVGVPGVFVTLLLILPFIDRRPERNPARRPVAMICGAIFAATITTLTLIGYYSGQGAAPAAPLPSPQKTTKAAPENVKKGEELFHSAGCAGCHRVNGEGGSVGPDLSDEGGKGRTPDWLATQIRTPKAHDPNSIMPSFSSLTDQEVGFLADFLLSLRTGGSQSGVLQPAAKGTDPPSPSDNSSVADGGEELRRSPSQDKEQKKQPGPAAYMIGNADHGKDIFDQKCVSCHGPGGTDNIPNPGSEDKFVPALNPIDGVLFAKDPQTFASNIDVFIQHGSVPEGPAPQFHMLAFGDDHTLTQQQIANAEAYILGLNAVDRAQIQNPGTPPERFFIIVVPGVIIVLLLLGGIYKCLP